MTVKFRHNEFALAVVPEFGTVWIHLIGMKDHKSAGGIMKLFVPSCTFEFIQTFVLIRTSRNPQFVDLVGDDRDEADLSVRIVPDDADPASYAILTSRNCDQSLTIELFGRYVDGKYEGTTYVNVLLEFGFVRVEEEPTLPM